MAASVSSSVLYQPKLKRTAPCPSVPSARCSRGAQFPPQRVAMTYSSASASATNPESRSAMFSATTAVRSCVKSP